MKKNMLILFLLLVPFMVQSQKIKSVDEFDFVSATKKDFELYDNLFEVTRLITDFGTFKKGDELLINRPQDGNLLRFSWIAIGKYSLLNAMAMIMYPSSTANSQIVINNIRIYGPIMERPASIIVDFKNKYDSNSVGFSEFGNIFNFGKAINTGEIVNPSTSLNRYQAIDKLKESRELLQTNMISQEKFNELKEKLTPLIDKNPPL